MKRVSFEVAKTIKEAGYPQDGICDSYTDAGKLHLAYSLTPEDSLYFYTAPTYLEVWLWLWREKKIHIDVDSEECYGNGCTSFDDITFEERNTDDPEEAIIAAIDYLVDNNLIE